MNEQQQNEKAVTPDAAQNTDTDSTGGIMIPKSRFDEVNNARRELESRLADLERQQQERAVKELEEQNRYRELYEKAQTQIEALSQEQQRAAQYREALQATNAARIAAIPEDKRTLIPDYDDPVQLGAWLDKAAPMLTSNRLTPPPTDGGAGNTTTENAKPLPDGVATVLEAARRAGYDINADKIRRKE